MQGQKSAKGPFNMLISCMLSDSMQPIGRSSGILTLVIKKKKKIK